MSTIDVHPRDLDMVIGVLARHIPHREVRVIGSRLTGHAKPFSDLDLVIMGDEPLGLGVLGALHDALDDSRLPFSVDLVEWATTSEAFRRIIDAQGRVLRHTTATAAATG